MVYNAISESMTVDFQCRRCKSEANYRYLRLGIKYVYLTMTFKQMIRHIKHIWFIRMRVYKDK